MLCPLLLSPIILLLTTVIDIANATSGTASSSWKQWSCDELTPNLCELQVESGSVTIQSIPVKYWRYTRRTTNATATATQHQDMSSSISHSIVALHGGPGWPHSYLLPLRQLACRGDTAEVIFYDQAGCGESVNIPPNQVNDTTAAAAAATNTTTTKAVKDHYPHLLDPKYYSEIELPTLINHWKLHNYHILGHSWGTILAQLFALNTAKNNITKGSKLQSLILSGPISDAKKYIAAQWNENDGNNLASLPPFIQGRIHALDEEKAYDTPEYEAIDAVLSTFFTMRTAPPPDCFSTSANGFNKEIYVGMQGASEFTVSGVLGDLNLTSRLLELTIPVLLTHGKFDTMRPSTVKTMQNQIKRSERVFFPHSGHVSMIDDPGLMNDAVASFIHRVENGLEVGMNVEVVAADNDVNVEEGVKVKSVSSCSLTWIKVVTAFLAGWMIGELKIGRRMNGNGYTSL